MNLPGTEPDARLVQAQLALLRGDIPTARDLCRQVLDTDPHWPAALALMGRIQDAAGQPDEALHWLAAAIERDPDNPVWKETRDKLLQNLVRKPSRNSLTSTREATPQAAAPDSGANLTLHDRVQTISGPLKIALIAGAILALALGITVGTFVASRPEPDLKPRAPSPPKLPDPIVVDQPDPGANAAPKAPVDTVTTPSGANSAPDPAPAPSPPAAPSAGTTTGTTTTGNSAEIAVSVENARDARWNPATATLSLWIAVDRPVPTDDTSRGEIRSTAETIVRNALPRFPDARRVRVQVEQWRGNTPSIPILNAEGEVPADPGAKAPILTQENWATASP